VPPFFGAAVFLNAMLAENIMHRAFQGFAVMVADGKADDGEFVNAGAVELFENGLWCKLESGLR
jgi:hypothetical protein